MSPEQIERMAQARITEVGVSGNARVDLVGLPGGHAVSCSAHIVVPRSRDGLVHVRYRWHLNGRKATRSEITNALEAS